MIRKPHVKNTESYGSFEPSAKALTFAAHCHIAESAENMPIHWKSQIYSQNNNE